MDAEIWASIGTIVVTLLLLIVPGVFYAWYVLDRMIGDKESYAQVMAKINERATH